MQSRSKLPTPNVYTGLELMEYEGTTLGTSPSQQPFIYEFRTVRFLYEI